MYDPYCGNYEYFTAGIVEQRSLMDFMMNHLAWWVLQLVGQTDSHVPTAEDAEALFKNKLRLELRSGLLQRFNQLLPEVPFNSRVNTFSDLEKALTVFNKNDVLLNGALEQALKEWLAVSERLYHEKSQEVLDSIIEELLGMMEYMFRDPRCGPKYVRRLLDGFHADFRGLIFRIHEEAACAHAMLETSEDMRGSLRKEADLALDGARQRRIIPIAGRQKYREYAAAVFRFYEHERAVSFCTAACKLYEKLLNLVSESHKRLVAIIDLLDALQGIFSQNESRMKVISTSASGSACYLGDFKKTVGQVDETLEGITPQRQDFIVEDFLSMLLVERKTLFDETEELNSILSRFIEQKFSDLLQQTHDLKSWFSDEMEMAKYIGGILLPRLEHDSRIHDCINYSKHELTYSILRIPWIFRYSNDRVLLDFIQRYPAVYLDEEYGFGIVAWLRLACGTPLFFYDIMVICQQYYDEMGLKYGHGGRYLRMGERENWAKLLPPLFPEAMWASIHYENPMWSKRFGAIRAMFDQAWEERLVVIWENDYVVATADRAEYDALMERLFASDANADGNKKAALAREIRQFLDKGWKPNPALCLKYSNFNIMQSGEHVVDRRADEKLHDHQILRENLLRTPKRVKNLLEQLRLKRTMKEALSRIWTEETEHSEECFSRADTTDIKQAFSEFQKKFQESLSEKKAQAD